MALVAVVLFRDKTHNLHGEIYYESDMSLYNRILENQQFNIFVRKLIPGFTYDYNFTQIIEQVNVGP